MNQLLDESALNLWLPLLNISCDNSIQTDPPTGPINTAFFQALSGSESSGETFLSTLRKSCQMNSLNWLIKLSERDLWQGHKSSNRVNETFDRATNQKYLSWHCHLITLQVRGPFKSIWTNHYHTKIEQQNWTEKISKYSNSILTISPSAFIKYWELESDKHWFKENFLRTFKFVKVPLHVSNACDARAS